MGGKANLAAPAPSARRTPPQPSSRGAFGQEPCAAAEPETSREARPNARPVRQCPLPPQRAATPFQAPLTYASGARPLSPCGAEGEEGHVGKGRAGPFSVSQGGKGKELRAAED